MKTIKVKIRGTGPILMHSVRLADRREPIVKEIAAINAKKTKRTDADYERMSYLEWMGGLWLNDDGKPCIPPDAILACLQEGARRTRNGRDAECGVWCDEPAKFDYDGPKDLDKLYEDRKFVDYRGAGVKTSKVMRTRPRFPSWSASFELTIDETVASERQVREWLEAAGAYAGIGDYRPRFGRFVVE